MPTLTYTLQQQQHRFAFAGFARLGRADDNDLCVVHESLSRRHAVVRQDRDGFRLIDEGSRNGILCRGQRCQEVLLEDGMVFLLGDVEFVFNSDAHAATTAASAPGPVAADQPVSAGPPPGQAAPPPPPAPVQESAAGLSGKEQVEDNNEATVSGAGEAPAAAEGSSPAVPEAALAQLRQARDTLLAEIGKVIVGQKEVLNEVLVALFARGHCLLIGVPGLAKTLMVKTLGQAIDLQTSRIQFTPDLMPSDITGTDILEEDPATGKREFCFHRGPLFTSLLLADEINRTPPKTQAALLEAMQERRVTAAGKTFELPEPFMVLATQNPIEQEGTYPLPEAQLDRFMFCVLMKYPRPEDERRVLLETTRDAAEAVQKVLDGPAILRCQHLVRQVPVSEHVALYTMDLIRATRPDTEGSPDFIKRWVRWGAGTRAGQYLLLAAKAHILLEGRFSVSCADVRQYALPVLRHRIFCNFAAASEGVSNDDIIRKVLETVKEPAY
jgi:MoxR-like ATPase